ncbi:hypothetical protein BJY04DRAFT_213480 [Aspergillus karnatakaensis]|uniref:uncharacterized protein n=1 Tax=Aspergillus karnatakaensis TaxID=1810916 RepID=UPI003CCD3A7B
MSTEYISQGGMSALMWLGVALSTILVALRTRVQYTHARKFFLNDHFIFLALCTHIASGIVYQLAIPPMYEVQYQYTSYIIDPETGELDSDFMARASVFLRLQFAVDFLIWGTLWAVKFSLLFFFYRLFESVRSPVRVFWVAMVGVTAGSWVTLVVLQCFACDPLGNFFTLGKCSSERDVYYSNLVFRFTVGTDIAGDLLIMLIPFPLLQHLRIPPRKKLLLSLLFSLPLIPILFAILRLIIANPTGGNVDPIKFQVYSMLENSAAIVTSCLPSLRLFVAKKGVGAGAGERGGGGDRSGSGTVGGMMYKYNYREGTGEYFRNWGGVGVGSEAEVRVGSFSRGGDGQGFGLESVERGRGRNKERNGRGRGRGIDGDREGEGEGEGEDGGGDTREGSRESQRRIVGGDKGVVVTREFSVRR